MPRYPFLLRLPDTRQVILKNRIYSGHESGVKSVVEAEKRRERERVEKQGLAMTMWRGGRGREGIPEREKKEAESERIREGGGASSPFYSAPDLPGCCQVLVGRGITGCCQVTVGWTLDRILTRGTCLRAWL